MKKNKNGLNLLFNGLVVVGLVLAVVGLFLNIWEAYATIGGETISEFFVLFADMEGTESAGLATVSQILLIAGGAFALFYVVLYGLEYFKVLKKTAMIRMLVSVLAVLFAIVAVVLAFVYGGQNTESALGITGGIRPAIGIYLSAAGSFVAGAFGVLASRK